MIKTEIPYRRDSFDLFLSFADLPWPVFLDSTTFGRYDIIAADPRVTLTTRGGETLIENMGEISRSGDDPLDLLRKLLGPPRENATGLPFCGGAIGCFGYDLGRRWIDIESMACDDRNIPQMMVGIYDWAIVVDHQQQSAHLVSPLKAAPPRQLLSRIGKAGALGGWQAGAVAANLDPEQYALRFAQVQRYIKEGDIYQANLALRFSAAFSGSPLALYRQLRIKNPAPFSAFFETPSCSILSASPERFLEVRSGVVETRPIKGTRPRSADPIEDARLAATLETSFKDRAENLMIVDLLRNDLGKVCETGSVNVPKLFEIESFATVHHLVSTVRGRLAREQNALSLLRASFPGGSITGAPKRRAMEIIEQLEPSRRGVYCGSIGYVGYDGDMDSNIAIRSMLVTPAKIDFWAGSGIVADSNCEQEYQEIHDKARALLDLLRDRSG